MENEVLFAWDDGGSNRVEVHRAGPTHVLVEAQHGGFAAVVRLPRAACGELAAALSRHVEATAPAALVAQVLQSILPSSSERTAVRVVDALRAGGYLPTEDAPAST